MDEDLEKRTASLSREQRRLLEMRLARLQRGAPRQEPPPSPPSTGDEARDLDQAIDFSILYFSGDGTATGEAKYQFLLETARFADQQGFSGVWIPERHFQAFGGLYPNPSVIAAALAVTTERVEIRAGSVVLPLHHPIRVAEEWAVVDNLSQGRVALSFATGWHDRDFTIWPQHYSDRRRLMFDSIDIVKQLWRGESVSMRGVNDKLVTIQTLPRPIRAELPVFVTSSGNPETWKLAGQLGTGVLGSLMGQTLDELGEKIHSYRQARQEAGHDPQAGRVAIMLHTFLGEDVDEVYERVREPLSNYLRSYLEQMRDYEATAQSGIDPQQISEREIDLMISRAFEKYIRNEALIGDLACAEGMVRKMKSIGVDEIACLIDFGLSLEQTLASLDLVAKLQYHAAPR